MRFAIMTFMFRPWWVEGRMEYETMVEGFVEAGVEGIEPFHRDYANDPAHLRRCKEAAANHPISFPAVDVMCNLVYSNATEKRQDRDELRRGLDICAELGSEVAHVAGHKLRGGVSPQDGRKMIADGLLEAAEIAEQYDLILAIEDFGMSPDLVCTADDCLEILRLTGDTVRFVFDTGNFEWANEHADENFDRMADRICHCHFKDFAPNETNGLATVGCDLGKGAVPNAAVARKLRDRGYAQWVALETIARNDIDPVSAVKRELPILKGWFAD